MKMLNSIGCAVRYAEKFTDILEESQNNDADWCSWLQICFMSLPHLFLTDSISWEFK
jgi:hypothetical protein